MTAHWHNWARTESSDPIAVLRPRTPEQVVLAVQRALETGHTVKPIGASHSFSAVGATDGIRLDMSRLRGLVSADPARGRVTLWAGTHLWELPTILRPLGLALENMGDIDAQTVSGATQTGTHGTGLSLGGLSTGIVGATLVTGTGELLTVSETENAELLPAVALGIGALGVLVTVTIQCVPRFLLRAVEMPSTFESVIESYIERTRMEDHFEFYWFPHTKGARTKTNTRVPLEEGGRSPNSGAKPLSPFARYLDEEVANNFVLGALVGVQRWVPAVTPSVNRVIEGVSSSREYTDESHRVFTTKRRVLFREMEYALPLEAVPAALQELRAVINRRDFRVSMPIEVRSAAADDLFLSTAHGRESGYIAVHRYWRDPDTEYFREAEAILASHDGRPHWGKMHTCTAEVLSKSYPLFDEFRSVRDLLDPNRIFANAYVTRVLGD